MTAAELDHLARQVAPDHVVHPGHLGKRELPVAPASQLGVQRLDGLYVRSALDVIAVLEDVGFGGGCGGVVARLEVPAAPPWAVHDFAVEAVEAPTAQHAVRLPHCGHLGQGWDVEPFPQYIRGAGRLLQLVRQHRYLAPRNRRVPEFLGTVGAVVVGRRHHAGFLVGLHDRRELATAAQQQRVDEAAALHDGRRLVVTLLERLATETRVNRGRVEGRAVQQHLGHAHRQGRSFAWVGVVDRFGDVEVQARFERLHHLTLHTRMPPATLRVTNFTPGCFLANDDTAEAARCRSFNGTKNESPTTISANG